MLVWRARVVDKNALLEKRDFPGVGKGLTLVVGLFKGGVSGALSPYLSKSELSECISSHVRVHADILRPTCDTKIFRRLEVRGPDS